MIKTFTTFSDDDEDHPNRIPKPQEPDELETKKGRRKKSKRRGKCTSSFLKLHEQILL